LKDKKRVRALHRKNSDLSGVLKVFSYYDTSKETISSLFSQIEWIEGDITEIPSLARAFKDITHVYHCSAYISFDPKKYRILVFDGGRTRRG
jgi:nucleoside-diphosphate-sugar epimerase